MKTQFLLRGKTKSDSVYKLNAWEAFLSLILRKAESVGQPGSLGGLLVVTAARHEHPSVCERKVNSFIQRHS